MANCAVFLWLLLFLFLFYWWYFQSEPRLSSDEQKAVQFGSIHDKDLGTEFSTTLNGAMDVILEVAKKIETRLKELEEKEKHWQQILSDMQMYKQAAKMKMVMDVGGKRFATSKETLLRFNDSYFCNLLACGWQPDTDGSYFIDRDPKYFHVILNYMRSDELQLEAWSKSEVENVKKEFDFYKVKVDPGQFLPPLANEPPLLMNNTVVPPLMNNTSVSSPVNYMFTHLPSPSIDILFNNNSKQAIISQAYQCNKGTLLEVGNHTWTVRLDSVNGSCDVGVVLPSHTGHFSLGTPTAWGIRDNGYAYHTPSSHVCNGFETGDIIKLDFDLSSGTLHYTINGEKVNFVHTGVSSPVHVAFSGGDGARATIVN